MRAGLRNVTQRQPRKAGLHVYLRILTHASIMSCRSETECLSVLIDYLDVSGTVRL